MTAEDRKRRKSYHPCLDSVEYSLPLSFDQLGEGVGGDGGELRRGGTRGRRDGLRERFGDD